MPVYAYKTINSSGALRQNRLEAASEAHAKMLLEGKGERVLQIKEISAAQVMPKTRVGKRPAVDEIATTIRQLSVLLRAGLPLVESLKGLAEQVKTQSLRASLEEISNDVSQGSALSQALSNHPAIFPTLAAEMAKIAEAGGNLAESMSKLADHMESAAEISRKVRAAMAYPIVIVILSFVTVIVMVTFILPRFMKLFDKMGAELPWTTKMLISCSNAMTQYWYLFILSGTGLFYLFKRYASSENGRRTLDKIALKLPVLGDVVSKIVLNRVIASMATLLSSGVPMVQTLNSSATAANNLVVKEALQRAAEEVAQGTATSIALKAPGIFPPLVIQMVESGEKTGELPEMLEYICKMYQRETDAKVKSLTSIIEPIMIVFLGVIVGFIAMSVIVPIYSLVGGVK